MHSQRPFDAGHSAPIHPTAKFAPEARRGLGVIALLKLGSNRMRLQRQASSRGNLINAGLNSLTAIGAQLPGNTLLHGIAPVGERLRGPVKNRIVKRKLDLVVLASGF